MTLNKSIIEFKETGECRIDINKAVKYFTTKCFISKWHDEFQLIRIRNKRCVALKVKIRKDDALRLILLLNLKEIKSNIFNHASIYQITDNQTIQESKESS